MATKSVKLMRRDMNRKKNIIRHSFIQKGARWKCALSRKIWVSSTFVFFDCFFFFSFANQYSYFILWQQLTWFCLNRKKKEMNRNDWYSFIFLISIVVCVCVIIFLQIFDFFSYFASCFLYFPLSLVLFLYHHITLRGGTNDGFLYLHNINILHWTTLFFFFFKWLLL